MRMCCIELNAFASAACSELHHGVIIWALSIMMAMTCVDINPPSGLVMQKNTYLCCWGYIVERMNMQSGLDTLKHITSQQRYVFFCITSQMVGWYLHRSWPSWWIMLQIMTPWCKLLNNAAEAKAFNSMQHILICAACHIWFISLLWKYVLWNCQLGIADTVL